MHWERSNVIGLAKASCNFCHGYGMRPVLRGTESPCSCVFRAVFRACYRRFRECVSLGAHTNAVTWERCGGPSGYRAYSRKREEFMADFCLVSRRTLEDTEYRVFRNHFLLGADWRICCRQLNIDRGSFFHYVYNIEDRLGRVFAELTPYALYPVAEYFSGVERREPQRATVTSLVHRKSRQPLSPLPLSA
jgi:hypothetical protein